MSLLLLLSLSLAGVFTPLAPLQDAPSDAAPVARAGEFEFSRAEYADWLVQQYGVTHLRDYVTSMLVLRLAEEDGLLPTDEQVSAAYRQEHDRIIKDFHRGDAERYYASLRARGLDPDSYRVARESSLRVGLAQEALARKYRQVTDDQIQKRYRDTYAAEPGQPGEHTVLEVMFFDMYATLARDGTPPDLPALKAEARQRAELARAELVAGATLADVDGLGNPVPSEFAIEGRIEPYRRLLLGPEVERAVSSLDAPGDVTPIIEVYNGCYLARLVERRKVTLEDVADTLRAEIEAFPPDSTDLSAISALVMERYQAELLLR